jgi:hypothetical protein
MSEFLALERPVWTLAHRRDRAIRRLLERSGGQRLIPPARPRNQEQQKSLRRVKDNLYGHD